MQFAAHSFEDFRVGDEFLSGARPVSRADIDAFTKLSGDHTALHSDDRYAASTPFGGVVAHGALSLALATGLAYETGLFEGTVLAVRSMDVRFERPVFPGDTLTLRLRVESHDPRPKPDRGLLFFDMALVNQSGKDVLGGRWCLLLRRRTAPADGLTPNL